MKMTPREKKYAVDRIKGIADEHIKPLKYELRNIERYEVRSKEIPTINDLFNELKRKKIKSISISIDDLKGEMSPIFSQRYNNNSNHPITTRKPQFRININGKT